MLAHAALDPGRRPRPGVPGAGRPGGARAALRLLDLQRKRIQRSKLVLAIDEDLEVDLVPARGEAAALAKWLAGAITAGAGGEDGVRLLRRVTMAAERDLVLGPGDHEHSDLAFAEDMLFDLLPEYNAALDYPDLRPRIIAA